MTSGPAASGGRPPGNVMLAFALALPVLMLLTVGLLDLGSYSLQKSAMLQGARAGAQYGILDYPTRPRSTRRRRMPRA